MYKRVGDLRRLFKRWLTLLFLLLIGVVSHSYADPFTDAIPDTFFWEIESHDGEISYLLGTIHIGREGSRSHLERYQPYLEKSAHFVTEVLLDLDDDTAKRIEEMTQQSTQNNSSSYLKELGDEQKFALKQIVEGAFERELTQEELSLIIRHLEQYQDWAILMQLIALNNPPTFSNELGVEVLLAELTTLPNSELESILDLIELFKLLPNEAIEQAFLALLKEVEEQHKIIEELYHHYITDNATALYRMSIDRELMLKGYPEESHDFWWNFYDNTIRVSRNYAWLPHLERFIIEGGAFIAIGAAHLYGEEGVLLLLKERGYQITPIIFD